MRQNANLFKRLSGNRLLLVLMALSTAIWIAVAKLAIPAIIKSAFYGGSLSIFNKARSIDYYLQKWDSMATVALVALVTFWLISLIISSPAFFRRFVGEATPGSLGAIRMWTCTILLITTFLEDMSSIALLPVEMSQHGGTVPFLYPLGLTSLVTSETALRGFHWLAKIVFFLGAIGCYTRVVIPLGALCHFLLLGILVDYTFFWHQNLVLLYLMAVLSFTPCGDGWSVDRLRKISRDDTDSDTDRAAAVYGWSRYACWAMIALPYVEAGLSKLRDGGWFWWNATNIRGNLYWDTLNPREFNWAVSLSLVSAPDVLFALLGIFTIIAELAYGLVLFSRIARRILPVLAMMMHTGILILQRILFLDLILIQFVFFDFNKLRSAIGQRLALYCGKIQVLYDGVCPLCSRTVRLLTHLDIFDRLHFLDFRMLDLNEYNRREGLDLQSDQLEKEMYVVSCGRVYRGFYGYRVIALGLPAFWPLAPWLYFPLISSVGASIYSFIAGRRMTLLSCHSHCQVKTVKQIKVNGFSKKVSVFQELGCPLSLSGVVLVVFLCWFYHIEFYPFTSWDVYSYSDVSGKVTYLKVFGRDESGKNFRARLEEGIGAVSYDARYSRVIQKCFGKPADISICKKFLAANASVYNKRALRGAKLTHYEIQKWIWDFRNNPSDPNYGKLNDRFIFGINTGSARREKTLEDPSVKDVALPSPMALAR